MLFMTLREWMKLSKLDDEQVATLVRANRSTISRLRRGKQRPSWELAAALEKATKGAVPVGSWAVRASAESAA
jgi:transcriptional regulator with XRE-family HTH domain